MAESDAVPKRITLYLPDLSGGGTERLQIHLAPHFRSAGIETNFLLNRARGALLTELPPGIRVDVLGVDRQLGAVFKLASYLRHHRPDVLITNMEHMNVMAVFARMLSGVRTRLVACQHTVVSQQIASRKSWQFKVLPLLYRIALPHANGIIAVSNGVARDLSSVAGIPLHSIRVIHNGVIGDNFDKLSHGELAHPWLNQSTPVILAVGRLTPAKDYDTLLQAFARVSAGSSVRLVILGEGEERGALETLSVNLGIADRIAMPGFVTNPLPSMRAARLVVLSSRYEGFGNVLAEALACGTPVVSTDCPFGPGEILQGGRFGRLTTVGDPEALSRALSDSLAETPSRARLIQRGQAFSVEACAAEYLQVLRSLMRVGTKI